MQFPATPGVSAHSEEQIFAGADTSRCEELHVLLACLRGENIAPLDAAAGRRVLALAVEQGLLPMVSKPLAAALAASAPEGAAEVARAAGDNAVCNLALAGETLRVNAALAAAGIETVIFKGCVLAALAHGSCAARQAGDIDLFVAKEHLPRAIETLARCGYGLDAAWDAATRAGHFLYDCECELRHAGSGMSIDLHWEFTARNVSLPMPVDRLMARAVTVPFCGRSVRTFSPEDQVLALGLHGAKHRWERIEWIYTLAAVIRRQPQLDWQGIMNDADALALANLLGSGLLLAERLFDLRLPPSVATWLTRNAVAASLADRCLRWIAAGPAHPPTPFEVRCFHAASRGSARGRARFWIGALMTPSEKDYRLPLPRWLVSLYYPIRTARLALAPLLSVRKLQRPPLRFPQSRSRTSFSL